MSEPTGRRPQGRQPPRTGTPFEPFVKQLLGQVAPSARLVKLLDAPAGHYTLHIGMVGRPPRVLLVNREMAEQAESNPAALRALRATLTTQLGLVGPANVIRGYRGTRIPPDTPCTVCGQPIREGERPAVKQARIMHARCATA